MIPEHPEQVTPVALLERAQAGDFQARDRLLGWAYVTAHDYYQQKTRVEHGLTSADAEDLASACYLEFSRAWPRIRAVYHYTRRMLKNNLRRHLVRARTRRYRETLVSGPEMLRRYEVTYTTPAVADRGPTDAEWLKKKVVDRVIRSCDERTQEVVRLRCADPGLPYRDIALKVGASEASLRMRMTRFYDTVRRTHALAQQQTARRSTQ